MLPLSVTSFPANPVRSPLPRALNPMVWVSLWEVSSDCGFLCKEQDPELEDLPLPPRCDEG